MGFFDDKLVRKVRVEKRKNEIVNRLNKTKMELFPDLAEEKEAYDRAIREEKKAHYRGRGVRASGGGAPSQSRPRSAELRRSWTRTR